ncbi:MAG: c-type cytochrome [Bacteroidia bacterium]|nr:c-type cytochrome [Bacteroidia bacterium]
MKFILWAGVAAICFFIVAAIPAERSLSQKQTKPWVAPSWTDTLKNPVIADAKSLAEGKKIYESACWSCHGKGGKGDGPAAKALTTPPADHTSSAFQTQSDGAIFWKITKGRGQMSPYEKTYSKTQRWKLVLFIRSLSQNTPGK